MTMAKWRKITAEQFLKNDAPGDDGWDEAYVRFPDTGVRREVWDVGGDDLSGEIAIYTSLRDPLMVPRDYPIEVR